MYTPRPEELYGRVLTDEGMKWPSGEGGKSQSQRCEGRMKLAGWLISGTAGYDDQVGPGRWDRVERVQDAEQPKRASSD